MTYLSSLNANQQKTDKVLSSFGTAATADLLNAGADYFAAGGSEAGLYDLLAGYLATNGGATYAGYASGSTNAAFATTLVAQLSAGTSVTQTVKDGWVALLGDLLTGGTYTRGSMMSALVNLVDTMTSTNTTDANLLALANVLDNRAEVGAAFAASSGGAVFADLAALTAAVVGVTNDIASVATTINHNFGSTLPAPTSFTVTASASSVTEGGSITYTITANTATHADMSFTYNVTGDTNGATLDAATAADFASASGTVTLAAGQSVTTFTVTPAADTVVESLEGFKVTVFNGTTVLGSHTGIITDATAAGGQTFTLTVNADTGAAFTGTSGNDTYVSQISADMGTGTTLNAGDNLNGAAGTDTLSVSVAGLSTAAVISTATTLTDIEKVLVSNFDSNIDDTEDHEFNAALWTGVTTVGLSSSSATGDTSFTNLKNIVAAEMANGAADLTVSYLSSVVAGTADSQALTVNGITAGAFVADAGIETIAITATGGNSTLTDLTAAGASKLTIAGDKMLTIGTSLGTTMKTIDASTNTGGVSLILGTADLTVTGGTGNDTIRIDGSTVDANDTINAGEGTDTLQLTAAVASSTVGAKLAGFENLYIYQDVGATNTVTQNASYITGITNVGVTKMTYTDDDDATVEAATVTAAFTGMSATQTGSISGITSAGSAGDTGTMTAVVSFALAADTTADSGTITLGTATAAAAVAGASNTIALNVTASDYETLSLVSQGGANTIGTLTAADATTLNINATKALTITTLTAAAVKTIDASASTAAVTVGATSIASTITGGAGNDTFTGSGSADSINGGAGKDTLDGGAGNDTVYGGAGNDSITGGTGNDKLYGDDGDDTFADATTGDNYVEGGAGNDTFNTTLAALTSADTILGGDGTDTLVITDSNANIDLTADITKLSNVSSVEVIGFTGLDGGDTVTVNDGVVSTAGGSLTLKFLTGVTGANTIDATSVLASASTVSFTDLATLATTYKIGNGKDVVDMGDGADTVTVTNNAYLSAVDTIAGGSGADTLLFTSTTGSTITAAQLTNVTGFETFGITTGGAGNYVLTLTDAIVGAQQAAGGTFAVTRAVGDSGTTKVDGSAVTSAYNLSLQGGTGADTLIGGAGNDSFDLKAGGSDSVTGGAGNDTFKLDDAENVSAVITDMNFGTSSTSVDILSFANLASAITLAAGNIDTWATADATTNVLIMNNQAYNNDTDLETALAGHATLTGKVFVFWQDSFGAVKVGYDAAAQTDATAGAGLLVLATLTGVTLAGLVSNLDITDLAVA